MRQKQNEGRMDKMEKAARETKAKILAIQSLSKCLSSRMIDIKDHEKTIIGMFSARSKLVYTK